MIRDFEPILGEGFPSAVEIKSASGAFPDMGARTINLQCRFDGQTTPDFTKSWEFVYKGNKYIMPLRKPQGSKDNEKLSGNLELPFQHWAEYQLQQKFFFELYSVLADTVIPDKYIASVELNLENFCILYSRVLEYWYGDKITLDIDQATIQNATSDVQKVEISYSYMWDVLLKFHEIYGVRFRIEPNGDADHYVIKIRHGSQIELSHIFEYGFKGGLLKVERQVQNPDIRNIILGRGGDKNLPYRYFKDVDPNNPSFKADPDWIPELAQLPFTQLHGATFRSYIRGWKAKHYGGTTTAADCYAPWAWQKGYTDEKFAPVEFVYDEESIAFYGELWGALDDNDNIYPSIQGRVRAGVGRVDEVVAVEPIISDDYEAKSEKESQICNVNLCASESKFIKKNSTEIVKLVGGSFTIPEGLTGSFDYNYAVAEAYDNPRYRSGASTAAARGGNGRVKEYDKFLSATVKAVYFNGQPSDQVLTAGTYTWSAEVEVENTSDKDLTATVNIPKPQVIASDIDDEFAATWCVWIKDVFNTPKPANKTPEVFAAEVWDPLLGDHLGNDAALFFTSGMLSTSEDYKFLLAKRPEYDPSQSINVQGVGTVQSMWKLTLQKSDADLEATNLWLPSTMRQASAGDHFAFEGIELPHQYVLMAEEEIDNAKKQELEKVKEIKPTWVVSLDKVRISQEKYRGYTPNLLKNTESRTVNAGANNYAYILYYFDSPLDVNAGDKFTISVENIEVLGGNPTEFSVIMYKTDGTFYSARVELTKSHPYATLTVSNATKATSLIMYAGKTGATSGNAVRYDKVMLVKGNKPMPWAPAASEMAADPDAKALIDQLVPGAAVRLHDPRFILNAQGTPAAYETLYITNVNIEWREPTDTDPALIPDVEITLSDKYEVAATTVSRMQSEIDALTRQVGSLGNIEQLIRAVSDKLYLRKDGLADISMSPTQFFSLLTSGDFRNGMVGGAGWGFFRDANGNWVLETDRVNVRQEMQVNSLVINQVKGQGGTIVEGAAVIEAVTEVIEDNSGYYCYFDTKNGTVFNQFRVDDVAYCHRYVPTTAADNAGNVAFGTVKFYKRRVIAVGDNYIKLSKTDVNGSGIPTEGDAIIHYGNYTDKQRQYVKVRDVIGGGYERYIEGLDSVNATGVEYYFVGRQAGMYDGKPRWFIGNRDKVHGSGKGDGSFIEYIDRQFNLNNVKLSLTSTIGDTTIDNYVNGAATSAANTAKAELQGKIDALQNQVDGVVEAWSYPYTPTASNYPANQWTTDGEKNAHVGDVFYNIQPAYNADGTANPNAGKAWRWSQGDDEHSGYHWHPIADSDAVRALQLAQMSVTGTDVLYKQHTSSSEAPELPTVDTAGNITNYNGWSTNAPTWVDGKFMWQTTYVKKGDGSATFSTPTCISGGRGPQGVPGPTGYTWIRYADDAQGNGISNNPTGKGYIGFAYNKTTATESNNPLDYTWSEIKGEQGIPGAKGADGKTYYTWIQYSDNANGNPMYQQPNANTKYIGIAVNKETETESNNPSDYTWSLFKGADGTSISISTQSVKYSTVHTATQPADSTFTLTAVPTNLKAGDYLWSRTEVMYSNGQPTVSYAVSRIGTNGANATIKSSSVTYAKSTTNVQPANSAFTATSIGDLNIGLGEFLWTKTTVTYSDNTPVTSYSVSRIGSDGDTTVAGLHIAYASGITGNLPKPTAVTGFSTTMFAGAMYIGIYTDDQEADSTDFNDYEWAQFKGDSGTPAKLVYINADATAFMYKDNFATLVEPQTIRLSATLQGTTGYHWSYKVAGQTEWTDWPNEQINTPNIVLGSSGVFGTSARSITLRCTSGDVYDEITIAKVSSGADGDDAYTILMPNQSHIFEGDTEKAVAASTFSEVIAYKGATKVAATIGTITGMPAGMTVAISNNGTTSAKFTVNVTTALTTKQGTLTVPVTVDSKTFTQVFSWSLSLQGKDGRGIVSVVEEYAIHTSGTTAPADSEFSTGIKAMTDAKRYLWNREKTTYTDNTSETTDAICIGVRGQNGVDGATVTQVINYYLASEKASGVTTAASEGWVTDASQAVTSADKPYLWNYEVTKWSKGADTSTDPHIVGTFGSGFTDNLLLKSDSVVKKGDYNIVNYNLAEKPTVGETYTFTLWGELAATKTSFDIYNSGGVVQLATLTKAAEGIYKATFKWKNTDGSTTVDDSKVFVFVKTSAQSGVSSIVCAKLEKGANANPQWTPNSKEMQTPTFTEQYYLSTSNTELSGGSWVDNEAPQWEIGKYIWTRTKIEYATGEVTYTDAVCNTGPAGAAAPNLVIKYSATGGTSESEWHPTYIAGDIWMKTSNDGGVTWSPAVRFQGAKGADGQYRKFQWALGSETAVTGTWQDAPMNAPTGQYVWMRSGIVVPPATNPTTWETATRLTGDKGQSGDSVYQLDLSDEMMPMSCDAAGNVVGTYLTSQASVFKGGTKVASGITYSIAQQTGVSATISTSGLVTPSNLTADRGTIVVQAVVAGITLQTTLSLYKVKPGANYSNNLLLNTDRVVSNGNYNVAQYNLAEKPVVGETYTITIWGSLSGAKTNLFANNSGDTMTLVWLSNLGNGVFRGVFEWKNTSGSVTVNDTFVRIYSYPSGASGTTTINKIKLEKGKNTNPVWTPAASEMIGQDGQPAVSYELELSANNISRNALGQLSTSEITIQKYKTTGASARTLTTEKIIRYQRLGVDAGYTQVNAGVNQTKVSNLDNPAMTALLVELYDSDGTLLLDRERVPLIQDGTELTENLVLNSDANISTNSYLMGRFKTSEDLVVNETYTFTIWGELGSGRSFAIYDSNSSYTPTNNTLTKVAEGVYSTVVKWYKSDAASANGFTIYQTPSTATSTSRLDKIKVEKGANYAPVWTQSSHEVDYLKAALRESGSIEGGLALLSLIQMGFTNSSGTYETTAGVNGIRANGDDLAFWAGGKMIDPEKQPNASNLPTFGVRHDGTAFAAGNTIKFLQNLIKVGEYIRLDNSGLKMIIDNVERLFVGNATVNGSGVLSQKTTVEISGSIQGTLYGNHLYYAINSSNGVYSTYYSSETIGDYFHSGKTVTLNKTIGAGQTIKFSQGAKFSMTLPSPISSSAKFYTAAMPKLVVTLKLGSEEIGSKTILCNTNQEGGELIYDLSGFSIKTTKTLTNPKLTFKLTNFTTSLPIGWNLCSNVDINVGSYQNSMKVIATIPDSERKNKTILGANGLELSWGDTHQYQQNGLWGVRVGEYGLQVRTDGIYIMEDGETPILLKEYIKNVVRDAFNVTEK